ncbi:MAG: PAS domain-containing protein [Alphaproteobacteria bacterium]|nr:PAS domain-containing protein [Alphaproteobacteria bacterium]
MNTQPEDLPETNPATEWAIYNLDADLRIISANAAARAYWGRDLAEVLSRRLPEAFPEVLGTSVFEEHLRAMKSFEVFRDQVMSPVLRRPIELAIFPHLRGLRVAFRPTD